MQIQTLRPELRANLRNLLQGYVEHCEFSGHLTGRIDFPIYYQGFKYGAPVFTHAGPDGEGQDRPVLGLIGWNTPHNQSPSQILLQLIEILVQHPKLAGSSVLRILPVANPVALELEEDAPGRDEWDLLGRLADQFREQAVDGWIEVRSTDDEVFSLTGEASPQLYAELEEIALQAAGRQGLELPARVSLKPAPHDARWQLVLQVPGAWVEAGRIHGVARFVARLVHAQSGPACERRALRRAS